jgi:hypothetical protein
MTIKAAAIVLVRQTPAGTAGTETIAMQCRRDMAVVPTRACSLRHAACCAVSCPALPCCHLPPPPHPPPTPIKPLQEEARARAEAQAKAQAEQKRKQEEARAAAAEAARRKQVGATVEVCCCSVHWSAV